MLYEAAVLDTHRIMMGPVNQSAEVTPFIQTPQCHSIAEAHRDPISQVDVVRDEHGLPAAHIQYEPLMSFVFLVVRQQTDDLTTDVAPRSAVTLAESGAIIGLSTTTHAPVSWSAAPS